MKVVEKSYNVLTIDVGDMTSGTPSASGLQPTVVVNALS